ncbi:dihydroneopterin aldolase [Virgibacillus phasianinus]|uniref:Dihydroneopterin aldolase n=1 Tax=Virgibacillus phasianinus TaxID=2017483 RepID=A0A220U061_9BACI|nr:DsbA family protein [Virgibacillus phasianinus]ASK61326.1 dihydroneopterin aldolase [Virgibacillus phasianinus]
MKSKNSLFKILVIITLIIVALIIVFVVVNNNNSDSNQGTTSEKQLSIDGQPTLGEPDAPVTVVEFGDFKCPACKVWGIDILPKLVSDYVETGKVKFAFINVLFHEEESKLGSLAAESVYQQNPDAYWDFHKALFKAQPSENHDSEWITIEKVLEIANGVPNIDTDKLKTTIENNSKMDELNKDTELVTNFDIQVTPTIMVNGMKIEDPYDYDAIKKAIESALEKN